MRKSLIVIAVVALAAAVMPAGDAADSFDCGDTVKRSIRLESSLANCEDDGLIVGAGNITIDLGGRTIDGDGSGAGILNETGYGKVVVTNGSITGFDVGVLVESPKDTENTIEDIEFSANDVAVFLDGADGNDVLDNELSGNKDGILVSGHKNLIEDNEIFDETPAIAVEGDKNEILANEIDYSVSGPDDDDPAIVYEGDENLIASNEILAGEVGIEGSGDENIIDGNELEGGAGTGILYDGDENEIRDNEIEGYGDHGINQTDGAGNLLLDNKVSESGRKGILVSSDETRVEGNEAEDNGNDGIHVDADDSRIIDNEADDNGFDDGEGYGILADGEGVEGSDNDARGNANSKECSPATLCE